MTAPVPAASRVRLRRTAGGGPEADAAGHARLADELAALCAAGVEPRAAWGLLGPAGQESDVDDACAATVSAVQAMLAAGGDVPDGLLRAPSVWAVRLAVVWRVSAVTGAPLSVGLAALAEGARAEVEAARAQRVALAGPRATARVLGALPLVGVLLGAVVGADPVGVLLGSTAGRVCLVAGAALWLTGRLWASLLVRAAARA